MWYASRRYRKMWVESSFLVNQKEGYPFSLPLHTSGYLDVSAEGSPLLRDMSMDVQRQMFTKIGLCQRAGPIKQIREPSAGL